mmetsp:Transcript_22164/g.52669  ORF Transcript_22164/g.52669 Transcript_22164/m.52669 type:complete len:468 (+) Transcript_22164:450-1853(+)
MDGPGDARGVPGLHGVQPLSGPVCLGALPLRLRPLRRGHRGVDRAVDGGPAAAQARHARCQPRRRVRPLRPRRPQPRPRDGAAARDRPRRVLLGDLEPALARLAHGRGRRVLLPRGDRVARLARHRGRRRDRVGPRCCGHHGYRAGLGLAGGKQLPHHQAPGGGAGDSVGAGVRVHAVLLAPHRRLHDHPRLLQEIAGVLRVYPGGNAHCVRDRDPPGLRGRGGGLRDVQHESPLALGAPLRQLRRPAYHVCLWASGVDADHRVLRSPGDALPLRHARCRQLGLSTGVRRQGGTRVQRPREEPQEASRHAPLRDPAPPVALLHPPVAGVALRDPEGEARPARPRTGGTRLSSPGASPGVVGFEAADAGGVRAREPARAGHAPSPHGVQPRVQRRPPGMDARQCVVQDPQRSTGGQVPVHSPPAADGRHRESWQHAQRLEGSEAPLRRGRRMARPRRLLAAPPCLSRG